MRTQEPRAARRRARALPSACRALLSLSALGYAAAGLAAAPDADVKQRLNRIWEAIQREDCKAVSEIGLPLIDARATVADRARAYAYEAVAVCAMHVGEKARAYDLALSGTQIGASSDNLWRLRFALEMETRQEAAVTTVETMAQTRPAALNAIERAWLVTLDRSLKANGAVALRKRLLKVLAGQSYQPRDGYGRTDNHRIDYAALLIKDGDEAGARSLIAALVDPAAIAEASLDPRMRDLMPPGADLRAAAEKMLARDREALASQPDRLAPLIFVASDLNQLGRPQEALDLLLSVSDRLAQPSYFTDRAKQLNWYWDAVAESYAALGRYDDLVSALRAGAAVPEGGGPNVSQVINLAGYQNRFGHGADALKTLAAFDGPDLRASPFGEMQKRSVRACSYALTGERTKATADLEYIRAHAKDAPGATTHLLLCMGDVEAAAAALIRALDDPARRAETLLLLSDFDDPPVALPPAPSLQTLAKVKARSDLQAAIARAGGIRRFALQRF